MGDYFKPWRRKLGLVTLALACLLTGMWIGKDLRTIQISSRWWSPFLASSSMGVLFFVPQNIDVTGVKIRYRQNNSKFPFEDVDGRWRWQWHDFRYGDAESLCGSHPRPTVFWVYAVPHWSIVIPLTLLSAWLLLSKPRAKRGPTQFYDRTEN